MDKHCSCARYSKKWSNTSFTNISPYVSMISGLLSIDSCKTTDRKSHKARESSSSRSYCASSISCRVKSSGSSSGGSGGHFFPSTIIIGKRYCAYRRFAASLHPVSVRTHSSYSGFASPLHTENKGSALSSVR